MVPSRRIFVALALLAVAPLGCGPASIEGGEPTGAVVGGIPNGTGRGTCSVSADCDDGVFCNGEELCVGGYCRRGDDVRCDDGADCTIDECDEVANTCQFTPDHFGCGEGWSCDPERGCVEGAVCDGPEDCDDGIFCNGTELCDGNGRCTFGDEVACDDGNDCTVDTCSEDRRICNHLARDNDGDGHADASCRGGSDCDDDDPAISPGARELCGDGVDNDCDRDRDCGDALCEDSAECDRDADRDRDRDRDIDRDDDDDRDFDRDGDRDRDRDREVDRGRRNDRRNDRDPCDVNRWYDDGRCDDVCWNRDRDCDRERDRNRGRRDDRDVRRGDRNDRRDQGDRRDRGVEDRRDRGACGRVPHTGTCVDRKTIELCTGEGRNARVQRRACEGATECSEQRGQRAECVPTRGNLPNGWNTQLCPAEWASDAGCDCGCGGVDPRCNGNGCTGPGCTTGSACEYCWNGNSQATRSNVCPGGVRSGGATNLPSGWNTNLCPAEWASDSGCDCGCGGVDPRCNGNGCTGPGCTTGSACEYCWAGTSIENRTNACAGGVSGRSGNNLPTGWNTNLCPAEWASDEGCDCGCGGVDPACNGNGCTGPGCTSGSACGWCWSGSNVNNRENVCPGGVSNANGGGLPSGWNTDRCPPSWATDDGCDCGCGGVDPACNGNGCTGEGCTSGSACGWCWTGSGDNRRDVCSGGVGNGANLPSGWDTDRCPAGWASDGGCDCGCGGVDPTCNGNGCTGAGCTTGSACQYCWNDSGQNVCLGGVQNGGNGGGGSLPSGWNLDRCQAGWANDSDCDCGCGGVDPACNGNGCTGEGCTSGSACQYCWSGEGEAAVNVCVGGVSGNGGEDSDLPSGWNTDRCLPGWASDGECDCGCGGADPACEGDGCSGEGCTSGSACEYCWSGPLASRVNHCEGGVQDDVQGDESLPSGWNTNRCLAGWASDGECDCGCGGLDPACNGDGCSGEGCTSGSACEYCWSGPLASRVNNCEGGVEGGGQDNGSLPNGWNTNVCQAAWATDGDCDCGCGGVDAACNGNGCTGAGCTSGSACDYCWDSLGEQVDCDGEGGEGEEPDAECSGGESCGGGEYRDSFECQCYDCDDWCGWCDTTWDRDCSGWAYDRCNCEANYGGGQQQQEDEPQGGECGSGDCTWDGDCYWCWDGDCNTTSYECGEYV